jgi:SNF2 family DNA or RNA helicase
MRLRRRVNTWFLQWCCDTRLDPLPHQLSALQWAAAIEAGLGPSPLRSGGILADEMGLGKTMVALALMTYRGKRHQLIVVPKVLLTQWRDIIRDRLGHDPLVIHGRGVHKRTAEDVAAAPIVLTTYGMVTRRARPTPAHLLLSEQRWGRVFFDEAHHLRNRKTAFLGAQALTAEHVWLLTGTPIQNSRTDLVAYWSLLGVPKMVFVLPGAEQKLIENHILKRTKSSLGLSLAEPTVTTALCGWQDHGERDISDQFHSTLACFGRERDAPVRHGVRVFGAQVLAAMVRCRQSCVTADLYLDELREWEEKRHVPGQAPLPPINSGSKLQDVRDHILEQHAADLAAPAGAAGRRRLVFCHYLGAMEFLRAALESHGLTVGQINGRTPVAARLRYATEPVDVLLLQIRTGCEGLNLQAYSDIYLVTPHWNPAVEEQAIGRCHRMGQERQVRVFRFVMTATGCDGMSLDNYCILAQERKRRAADIIPIRSN